MIKIRYAKFANFRGLRNVKIDFSTSDNKPLTVIRAANYTGKTTVLYGLTWALFGDAGLPMEARRRSTYRLHPIDWDVEADGAEVNIEVEVGLSVLDEKTRLATEYTLFRRGREIVSKDSFLPQETTYDLVKHGLEGDTRVVDPDRIMDRVLLPAAKKDIFFVDGDARVNQYFADADDRSSENVREAVRHLLALDVVESASVRMSEVLRVINSRVKKETVGTQAEGVAKSLEVARGRLAEATEAKKDAEADNQQAVANARKAEERRTNALTAGGGEAEELRRQLEAAGGRKAAALAEIPKTNDQMRKFLNAHQLYENMSAGAISRAGEVYERLRRERKIPNVLPEMLRERLQIGVCICGADLSVGSDGHRHLVGELREVEVHSESRALLGTLASKAGGALQSANIWCDAANASYDSWLKAVQALNREKDEIDRLEHDVTKRAAAHEDLKIADQNLRLSREAEKDSSQKLIRLGLDVETQQKEVARLSAELDTLIRRQSSFAKLRAEQQVATDLQRVLGGAVDVLLGDTIDDVSRRLNALFMRMIAASPEAMSEGGGGVVQEVRLTRDCVIEVYGSGRRRLMPRTDLSGAQQQSLTVALIMALIEVSGDTSPTVIDTPLGRTSGQVRRNFLSETLEIERLVARDADADDLVSQKILLMTPQEIEGLEDLLSAAGGKFWTLSNSQHYPLQLVNSLPTRFSEVFVCGCGPGKDSSCGLCARVDWV